MIWALAAAAQAHVPVLYFAGPDDDWCGVFNASEGSDVIMLDPGEYRGPCVLHANLSNVPGEQTTLQSLDPLDPAVFVGSDADYVLHVEGESLLLLELSFRDVPAGIDPVRIGGIREIAVRRSWFSGGDAGVVQLPGVVEGLAVSDTQFVDVGRAVTVGCGGACEAERVDVSQNLVLGGLRGLEVGGTGGLVLDNVLSGVGEGIAIVGAAGGEVEVAGNLVDATGAAIRVDGGALVRANVVLGAPALAATGPDVRLEGNTAVIADDQGLDLHGVALVNTAVLGPAPALAGDVEAVATVACDAACFVDAAGWDFFPAAGSPLRGAGVGPAGRDWCDRVRAEPPSVGAVEAFGERSFGPLAATFKADIDCALPDGEPTGTTTAGTTPTVDTAPPPDPPADEAVDPEGCGCAGDRAGGAWAAVLAWLLLRRRSP
ncbi:MAG: hypothetical protein R3F59_36010 [Myxococcota bacterium]